MEVSPGYKLTEIGVIPEDWDVRAVGDIARIKTGPFGTVLKASEYSGKEGVPLISVGEIGAGRLSVTNHTPRVPKEVIRRLPQYLLRGGDIVFGRKGAVERSALVTEQEDGWFMGSDGICVRPQRSCSPAYLAAQCQGRWVRNWLVQNAIGTTMPSLNQGTLARLLIPLAPIYEQQAIAAALTDVQALVDGLARLISKKRDLKQAAMQRLLTGKGRLPGFTGTWQAKRLGDLGFFLKGSGVRKDEAQSGALACVRYGEIYTNHHDVIRTFRSWIAPEVAARAVRLRRGDLLFAGSGETKAEIGKCVAFVDDIEAYAGGDIVILRPERGVDPTFLGYYLNTPPINAQKASMGQGDAVVHIGTRALADILVTLPRSKEQTAIADVLCDIDAELAALEARLEKTKALQQAMMQELLTGRTRLVAPELAHA